MFDEDVLSSRHDDIGESGTRTRSNARRERDDEKARALTVSFRSCYAMRMTCPS